MAAETCISGLCKAAPDACLAVVLSRIAAPADSATPAGMEAAVQALEEFTTLLSPEALQKVSGTSHRE